MAGDLAAYVPLAALAGILTMTSLYSINIRIMSMAEGVEGTSTLFLLSYSDKMIYTQTNSLLGIGRTYSAILLGALIAAAIVALLYWFFGTELGCTIRATGDNEKMCRAQGINTDLTKILGLSLSNGLVALSGCLLCQYQSSVNVNMGVGAIVIGLASIIIGETIFMRAKGFIARLSGIVVGAVIYRVIVSVVVWSGMPAADLKLLTALVVVVALGLPTVMVSCRAWRKRRAERRATHAE